MYTPCQWSVQHSCRVAVYCYEIMGSVSSNLSPLNTRMCERPSAFLGWNTISTMVLTGLLSLQGGHSASSHRTLHRSCKGQDAPMSSATET